MDILLTVIIPMFNVQDYIGICLESILNQTFKDFEIIVIDDGSTDDSYLVAMKYVDMYPNKIKMYRQPNLGQASARNLGLLKARGKYISFIDSDDFIDKNMYECLIGEAQKFDLDIIQCSMLNWYGENSSRNFVNRIKKIQSIVYNGKSYFEFGPTVSPCDKVFKREFLKKVHFSFEEGRLAEDALGITKLIHQASKIKYIDNAFYYYRRDNLNSTRNSNDFSRMIKLGKDKIFIAWKLNEYRKTKGWNGAINRIIVRNIVGSFIKKSILNKTYRKAIIHEFKLRNGFKILNENFKLSDISEFFEIGFNKLIRRQND